MKIAVSADSPSMEAAIDPRFGRCAYFLFIETDDMSFEAIENTNAGLSNAAGIQSAQLVAEKGAGYILTGRCGPNSQQALSGLRNRDDYRLLGNLSGTWWKNLKKAGCLQQDRQIREVAHKWALVSMLRIMWPKIECMAADQEWVWAAAAEGEEAWADAEAAAWAVAAEAWPL